MSVLDMSNNSLKNLISLNTNNLLVALVDV